MLTFDGARLQYAEYRLFLAVDSDELLAPSWQSKFSVIGFNNELMKIWSKKALKEQEEIAFYRFASYHSYTSIALSCINYLGSAMLLYCSDNRSLLCFRRMTHQVTLLMLSSSFRHV